MWTYTEKNKCGTKEYYTNYSPELWHWKNRMLRNAEGMCGNNKQINKTEVKLQKTHLGEESTLQKAVCILVHL